MTGLELLSKTFETHYLPILRREAMMQIFPFADRLKMFEPQQDREPVRDPKVQTSLPAVGQPMLVVTQPNARTIQNPRV